MELTADPAGFLGHDRIIEVDHPEIALLSAALRGQARSEVEYAGVAFEWVRDRVAHSVDAHDPRVTVSASSVLRERVGLCYAKSHLLTALLRNQGIAAGLCYQRLGDPVSGYALHGLVAVHLNGRWHRQDPRGNKPGVDARFSLGQERLAFEIVAERGEVDYPTIYAKPAPAVVSALESADDVLRLCQGGLPDRLPRIGRVRP